MLKLTIVQTINSPLMGKHITKTNIDLNSMVFPGGEVNVNAVFNYIFDDSPICVITAQLTSSEEVMKLIMLNDILRRQGLKDIEIIMPYVPYARQDRVCNPGEAHSLRVFAGLINNLKFKMVHVFDPHSDVTEAVFDNVFVYSNHEFVSRAITDLNLQTDYKLVSPDAGAYKKISKLGEFLQSNDKINKFEIVQCGKNRDLKTGKLSGFSVNADDLQGKPCVVVDDILDGGGTFLGLATELKKKNAGDLFLIISHGIFSQGFDKLLINFNKIFFSNSFKTFSENELELGNERLIQYDCIPLMFA